MRFQEIASRVTGFSTPVFGVSWQPPEAQVFVARRVIAFLEDRRVLYVPSEMEVPAHCVDSIIEIRRFLTAEMGSLDDESDLKQSLRAMRVACRKFLDDAGAKDGDVVRFGGHHNHWASWRFNGALGELRGVFGIHLARVAAEHGLDIEDELATILPGYEHDDGDA